ncbi:iron ABC transporter ATP-binding protein [Staphylococcus petrasii]|uniref:ABC transporter ATP-binding protein n=1 Tax=Staphylococcus petrasii TaxID=1276936 RepID=UPI000CD00E80|nr:ABC transporter ATP-binding protein [Staphylococcus petrasii]PNZ80646.1 iron ABC transporter ATP-binding protein [Staphylococcus petrasii]TGA79986.1 ABC transporter ATP-binding protein [Staphylococcus petrasii]SUM59485.1 ABC transporter ATP-binding protein [Staphylococcus petrasii]
MLISLENISKKKQGKLILNQLSWEINEGDKWVLYGLNGAGKTTLLNILNGYDSITDGAINLFGMQPGRQGYSATKVREQIGYVSSSLLEKFQEGETVLDVVISGAFKSIGVYEEVNEALVKEAETLLQIVGMYDFQHQFLGYLSTGQKQKVMIARALMNHPKMLILDEPASGLDFIARETLFATLERLNQAYSTLSIIYVTHFIEEVIPLFDKIFLLKEGKCFKQGDISDILNSDIMSRMFKVNVEVVKYHQRWSLFLKNKNDENYTEGT